MRMNSRVVAGLVCAVLWSSGFVGVELGTRAAPAFDLLTWRAAAATPLLLIACLVRGVRVSRRELGQQAVLAVLVQVGYLGAITLSVGHGVSAGTTALVAALQPMAVAVAAGPLLGERVGRLGWAGLGVGLVGVGLVVVGDVGGGLATWWLLGPVVGMLSLSAGTLLGRRWETPSSSVLLAITVQTGVAGLAFAAVDVGSGTATVQHEGDFWLAVAWAVGLSTVGGYGSYLLVLRQQGATRASTWLYLSPPITMLWAWLMFGDRIGLLGVAGIAVAAVGVGLVLRGSAPRADAGAAGRRRVGPVSAAGPRTPSSCGRRPSAGSPAPGRPWSAR